MTSKPTVNEINFILKLFNLKKLDEVKNQIDKDLKKYPNSAILFNMLGVAYAQSKETKNAEKNFRKAIEADSNYAQAYNNLGTLLYELKNLDEAIDYYEKAINLKNDYAEPYEGRGDILQELSKVNKELVEIVRLKKIKILKI